LTPKHCAVGLHGVSCDATASGPPSHRCDMAGLSRRGQLRRAARHIGSFGDNARAPQLDGREKAQPPQKKRRWQSSGTSRCSCCWDFFLQCNSWKSCFSEKISGCRAPTEELKGPSSSSLKTTYRTSFEMGHAASDGRRLARSASDVTWMLNRLGLRLGRAGPLAPFRGYGPLVAKPAAGNAGFTPRFQIFSDFLACAALSLAPIWPNRKAEESKIVARASP
jgi:hypothetical protein